MSKVTGDQVDSSICSSMILGVKGTTPQTAWSGTTWPSKYFLF
eukprot:SAG25_NODE_1773_length_2360_cov_2.922158_2_plen_43_part_00